MIKTEVRALGGDEHEVHVHVPQDEYDRIYASQLSKLSASARLPGFRPGKTPRQIVEQQFGGKAHEDTVSELVQNHYAEAIEQSGLEPAIQPELDLPFVQPEKGFHFTLKVVTWPEVKLKQLSKLSVIRSEVKVDEADVKAVVDRLVKQQTFFEHKQERKAQSGDQLHIDFEGLVDDKPFDGGKGRDVKLVLGEGKFLPDFEEALAGARAGDDVSLKVGFPGDYTHKPLAGKDARFEVTVKSVAVPVKAESEDELAKMLSFRDTKELREDIRHRLSHEAEQAEFELNRQAAFDTLLDAHDVTLPETMVKQDMHRTSLRLAKSMREQGMEAKPEVFEDPAFQDEIRQRSERALKVSLLLNAVHEQHGIEVSDEEVEAELERQADQYPEDRREAFKNWMHGQKEQMAGLRDQLLEKKCVECIMEQAKTKVARMSLSQWQDKRDAGGDESGKSKEAA